MQQVLITVSGGIIDQVKFYNNAATAVHALSGYVKTMEVEEDDAAVYGPDGMIVNAKSFLDNNDQYVDNRHIILEKLEKQNKPVYIIGNPHHFLGFMVTSFDDPLGYTDPLEALSDLGQIKQEHGNHLKLYKVVPVKGLVVVKADLERHNADCEVEDFDYALVSDHLK